MKFLKQHIIWSSVPQCPYCEALIHTHYEPDMYVCNDCKKAFKIIGNGQADKEVVVEEIERVV